MSAANPEGDSCINYFEPEKVLVTGANGFIGKRLLMPGDVGLIRRPSMWDPSHIEGDLLDIESLIKSCKGIEVIYHCAGYAHAFKDSDPLMHWKINFEGTKNLLHAAIISGVKKFIFFSSVKAMDSNITSYGQSKLAAENAVLECGKEHGLHVVNLRLSMVYGGGSRGNLERMIKGIKLGWFPPLGDYNNKRTLIHVDDVISAARFVANNPAANMNTYILTDGNEYSTHQLYQQIRHELGMSPVKWFISAEVLKIAAGIGDLIGYLFGRSFPLNSDAVKRLIQSDVYSSHKIQNELGWFPSISLEKGLRDSIDAMKDL